MLDSILLAINRYAWSSCDRAGRTVGRVSPWMVERASRAKLVRMLRYVYRNCPSQRKLWEQAGVKLRDLRIPDVLPRIPFSTGKQVKENPRDFWCVPQEELIHVIGSSGTTGKPKRVMMTVDDYEHQARLAGVSLRRLPGASRILGVFLVTDPTCSAGAVARRGIEEAGMLGLIAGTQTPIDQQVGLIRDYRMNVLMTYACYAHRMTLEAGVDLRELGVRYLLLAAQAFTEGLRRTLEDAWGAKVIDMYGSTECGYVMSAECLLQDGLHVSETDFWCEIIDPDTGKVLADGEEGELVFTTLARRGMPFVRYRTGDITHLVPRTERCECGLPMRRMARVRGRADDMLIVGSWCNVYPDEFDQAVFSVPGVSDYQLIIEKDSFRDVLNVTVETDQEGGDLRQTICDALLKIRAVRIPHDDDKTLIFGKIQPVPRGTLTEGRSKSIRVIDKRENPTSARAGG